MLRSSRLSDPKARLCGARQGSRDSPQPTAADRASVWATFSRDGVSTSPNGPSVVAPYTEYGRTAANREGAGRVNQTTFPARPRGRTPALADRGDQGEPAPGCAGRVGLAHGRQPGVVVVDGDSQSFEQELDLYGARFVRLCMPVDIGQQFGDAQRCLVDQRVQMPVAQLRRDDSADLTDPRRQGLELHRAVPAWLADHGCDSPK